MALIILVGFFDGSIDDIIGNDSSINGSIDGINSMNSSFEGSENNVDQIFNHQISRI